MNPRSPRRVRPLCPPRASRGYVLATGLLFLMVITLLGVALFRNTGLLERIAGNTRDKQRSFEMAQEALQYGEWWLGNGNGGMGSPCTGNATLNGNDLTAMQVCSNAPANMNTLPWPYRWEYLPPNVTIAAGGGLTATGFDVNYAAKPGLYIQYLGLTPDGKSQVYQVNGYGGGGNADTVSVVRSTYQLTAGVKDLGGL